MTGHGHFTLNIIECSIFQLTSMYNDDDDDGDDDALFRWCYSAPLNLEEARCIIYLMRDPKIEKCFTYVSASIWLWVFHSVLKSFQLIDSVHIPHWYSQLHSYVCLQCIHTFVCVAHWICTSIVHSVLVSSQLIASLSFTLCLFFVIWPFPHIAWINKRQFEWIRELLSSVTRLGNLLDFGQLFETFSNN